MFLSRLLLTLRLVRRGVISNKTMLYFVGGKDFREANAYIRDIINNQAGASVVSYTLETFSPEVCEEHLASQALFGEKTIVIFDGLLSNKEHEEYFKNKRKALASSPNIFIIREEKVGKKTQDIFARQVEKIAIFDGEKRYKEEGFSIFSLADAVGARDKKKAWLLLQKAFAEGVEPEQIYGTLFWQTKTLTLVKKADHEGVAPHTLGLNPFVLRKAQRFAKNYSQKECTALLSQLIEAYHNARAGRGELSPALERFVLTL